MVATMPESIHRSSLDGYVHTLDPDFYVLCYGWLRPYHIHHVLEISVVLLHAGSPVAVFSVGHVLVKHFTPLFLGLHALGGICNLSPFLLPLLPHIGGIIPGPVRSDIT